MDQDKSNPEKMNDGLLTLDDYLAADGVDWRQYLAGHDDRDEIAFAE